MIAETVVIIGGGPAGSCMGCYLSKAGIPNILIEKAVHPRPHVGESLVTSTTRVFQEIDFVETMEREGFVRKYGASWHPPMGTGAVSIEFREFPQEGIHQDYTYHVDRSKFDLLLLQHAKQLGTKVHQNAAVKDVLFEGDRAVGVRAEIDGKVTDIAASVVVDASGRNTIIGKKFGWKITDPLFNQYAVHAWFKNVDRGGDDTKENIHIYFLGTKRGWVWQIPISDEVTSVGVVAEKSSFQSGSGDHEAWFAELIESAPDPTAAMANAVRINDFKVEADYSYSMKQLCGDGFVLIGDAARFVDPIFSSGVSVALYSARMAADAIRKAYDTNDFTAKVFQPYDDQIHKGTKIWYEFIRLYYKVLPVFTYFIEHKDYRQDIFRLLQGEVYDRDDAPVLEEMRKFVRSVEQSKTHVFRSQLDETISIG